MERSALVSIMRALSSCERLKVFAELLNDDSDAGALSRRLGLSHKDLLRHVAVLREEALVSVNNATGRFSACPARFDELRRQAWRYLAVSGQTTPEQRQGVGRLLKNGRIVAIPERRQPLMELLAYVSGRFQYGKAYSEKEVNEILSSLYEDVCTLRRTLVDYRVLIRDPGGSRYALRERST